MSNCFSKEFLNLGPQCHLQTRFDSLIKKMELELLYNATWNKKVTL